MKSKRQPSGELETIPGVGPSLGQCLRELGYNRAEDLAGEDPEEMYKVLCELRATKLDRCVLYVFRCATYFADNSTHDPDLLKWWKWKDERQPSSKSTRRRAASAGR